MQCDCIKRTEDQVKEFVQPKINAPIQSVKMGNTAFVLEESGLRVAMYTPVYIKADARGYRSERGGQLDMHFSFCPFCGKPAKAEQVAA
ncbi:hypothetical protein ACOTI9_20610 [Achromobacter mucicolens]|uniref:hypothetical protein n=1 Tax=Achromobacter mucicolens TaxID=1389922 RepID=UPI0021D0D92C|nr:hypothetical protein [Achromobacter mucicolens]MCU6618595.1 hypothetical protein [Achromobacter mucicolens]